MTLRVPLPVQPLLRRMLRAGPLAVIAAVLLSPAFAPAAEAQDVVVLKDGREVAGKIIREEENAVFLKAENGEERGIARSRIEQIIRAGQARPEKPAAAEAKTPGAPATVASTPATAAGPLPPGPDYKQLEREENRRTLDELRDLGDSNKEKRHAALERAKVLGFRAVPVLLGMLHPREKLSPELRIGALRALAELGPLDLQGAQVLAWTAMKDSDPEVRREACRTIKRLRDDRAMEYILQFAVTADLSLQSVAAQALREINDDRSFATLAGAIPAPSMTAAMPEAPSKVEEIQLPVGPLGGKMPIFLPTQGVTGSGPVGSPPADTLRLIAGKDISSSPYAWINWLREKCGLTTAKEREDAWRNRSMRDRIGNPPTTR